MFTLEEVISLWAQRPPGDKAMVAAYLLAPALVLAVTIPGAYTHGLGLDVGKPFAVSQLQTEVTADGRVVQKRGVALTVEPLESEYQIPFQGASGMWISLDEASARANADRLVLTQSGFRGRSPLIGVSRPVTVVVQGEPGAEILVPGGSEALEDWSLQSRMSASLVSSVLLACVFGFGMSLATGFPSLKGEEHGGRKERAKPHKR